MFELFVKVTIFLTQIKKKILKFLLFIYNAISILKKIKKCIHYSFLLFTSLFKDMGNIANNKIKNLMVISKYFQSFF